MIVWGLVGAFALGVVTGLRTFTAFAALALTRGGWPGIVLAILALLEYAGDLMPTAPSRTAPVGLGVRVVVGAVVGWLFASAAGAPAALGAVLGVGGALVGAFGGHGARIAAIDRMGAIPAALAEDAVAIALAAFIVTRTV